MSGGFSITSQIIIEKFFKTGLEALRVDPTFASARPSNMETLSNSLFLFYVASLEDIS
jgi:hypothetical protein